MVPGNGRLLPRGRHLQGRRRRRLRRPAGLTSRLGSPYRDWYVWSADEPPDRRQGVVFSGVVEVVQEDLCDRMPSGPLTLARTVCASFAGEMLVYDFIHIPLPVAQVRQRLLIAVTGLWQQVAAAAYDEGEELLSRVGPFGPVPGLSKAVSVQVGKLRDRGEGFVVPLQWSATGPTELFPVMQADLEIAPLGAHQSQLSFSGSYDPPLGFVGRQLDRLLLHQLAEATVRALLSQLVAALLAEPEPHLAVPSATTADSACTPPLTSTTDTPTPDEPTS